MDEIKRLWEDYAGLKTMDLCEKLILAYMPMVEAAAWHFARGGCCNVEYDDLASCGMIGLIKAVDSFRDNRGASFRTYAGKYIRVEMYKMAEKMSWMPCTSRRRHSQQEMADRGAFTAEDYAEYDSLLHGFLAAYPDVQVKRFSIDTGREGSGIPFTPDWQKEAGKIAHFHRRGR